MSFEWRIKHYDTVQSTQDTIKELLSIEGEGLVISAAQQLKGRGRHNRVWESSNVNLSFSFILKPNIDLSHIGYLSLITGLAVYHEISDRIKSPDLLKLKWPNDIIYDGRKLCGILIEKEDDYFVIGIGVNTGSAPIEQSIHLSEISRKNISNEEILRGILSYQKQYYQMLLSQKYSDLVDDWKKCAHDVGQTLSVKVGTTHFNGTFHDLDEFGNLLLKLDQGNIKRITAGDVYLGA